MPPPLPLHNAVDLIEEAADRGRQRLGGLLGAARALLDPLPPEEVAARFLERAEVVLAAQVALRPHEPGEPPHTLIDADGRRLRVPLWESGPMPEGTHEADEDLGHRAEFCRQPDEPRFSPAEIKRAAVLSALGSLALVRAHCELALADLDKDVADLRAQLRNTQIHGPLPEDPLAGRGLTSGVLGPLERLAGVLAHELNNPLTFVLANLSCLEDEHAALGRALSMLPGAEGARAHWQEMAEVMAEIHGGAGRVREVVADLTTLGTRGEAERPVVLEEVVRAALRIARREVQRRAQVFVDLDPALPRVIGSASRLGQVVLNLLLNAVQAVPPGEPAAHQVRISATAQGDRVVLCISDTGSGIAADNLPRVFEPGYTTKPTGEGSGLGLAISQEIVRTHGGEIHIESKPGQGTTVTVLLPAHA